MVKVKNTQRWDHTCLLVHSLSELREFGSSLAQRIQRGDVFLLKGCLGAGKTELARSIIQSLCYEKVEVPSPTFTFLQVYETISGLVYHYDLYRVEEAEDIWELGLEEALAGTLTMIEWPERLPVYLRFKQGLLITISISLHGTRKVVTTPLSDSFPSRSCAIGKD